MIPTEKELRAAYQDTADEIGLLVVNRTGRNEPVTVTVDGRSSTLASAFTYVALPPPAISSVAPSSGSTSGGTTITVTGANFASGATVTIGGVAATGVTVLGSTSLRAVTGPRAAGVADVSWRPRRLVAARAGRVLP